ncbi:cytochrome c3 family protein [Novipirellula sp. SH528]|uniref:cytochrome c3 family protein n=1 Tax=Novipirellula sp. SH528 TaxID=3454466 RepID=UPI003F9FE4DA
MSIVVVVAVVVAIGVMMRVVRDDPPDEMVQAVAVTTVNPSPGIPTFVGRQVCGECHAENYHLHGKSGHASTFISAQHASIAKKFVGSTVDAGQPHGRFTYVMDEQGLKAVRVDDADSEPFPLQYALGSGHNAVTFFSLIPDQQDGTIGFEHRVSWFADHAGFGLTPGHVNKKPSNEIEFFGNPVRGEMMHGCVDCHTTSGTIVDQKIVDLIPNVNCEKCHGPGSEHVRQARLSDHPPAFSVGKDNWDQESELQLCGSCHRLPKDISPKKLREYPSELVRFQPIGMLRSACYLEAEGQMMCTTCHNPHQAFTAKSKQAYVDDCVRCHDQENTDHVACPVSPRDGCIECHMPPVRFEQGMIFHDHWIRVRPE